MLFLGYGYYGGLLPQSWPVAHAGLDFGQLVDAFYNSDSGFYGTPLDVAASYIVLFTIYGAVLDLSGAGRFFVELSAAAFRRSRTAAGRTAVASGFLLGTVSGSGAATTVSIGAVTWPILRRAGYPAERAGGMLAAAGVGAILSPPTLGAAAFIIAEYLGVSYLQVLGWATVPTILYYLGILLSVEIDARRSGVRPVVIDTGSAWRLLARFGYHFLSLLVIIVVLALGASAMRAVVIATVIAAALSFLDRRHRLTPARLVAALRDGVRGVLAVSAVCAAAGIITATTTKTGLGPQAASLLIGGAQAVSSEPAVVLALTAVLAAVALSLLGLAVPVTASFVIGWVIIGPALLNLGVAAPAAAMFVFYFAVLSEVSPPTALAAVAAAAVTGGRLVPTMWQTLRYALPAYLIPLAFVITPTGLGLLGIGGAGADRDSRPGLRARRGGAGGRGRRLAARRGPGRRAGADPRRGRRAGAALAGTTAHGDRRGARRARGRGRVRPTWRRRARRPPGGRRIRGPWGGERVGRIDARIVAGVGALVLVAAGAAGCGGRQDGATKDDAAREVSCKVTKDTRVGIATGNATGVYYVVGNALAGELSKTTDGKLTGTAAETGASVQNVEQLVAGQYDVAFSLFDTAVNAVQGKGSFTAPQPVKALARIYDNYTQVVVRADAGITSVADMKGKKISTGSPKSGTEVIANRLLTAAGLDPAKDVQAQRLDLTKTVDGMKDGSIDGFFWSGGVPTGGRHRPVHHVRRQGEVRRHQLRCCRRWPS